MAGSAATKKTVVCPNGFSGLVLLSLNDSDYSISVFVPSEKKPLADDSDFFHNLTEDGNRTGIDIPEYLNGIGSRIFDFDLDKDDAADLISRRLAELKCLQTGGFIQEDVAFEVRDERS